LRRRKRGDTVAAVTACNVRTMHPDEVGFAIELAAREGWNPGLHDAEAFALADSDGFLVAEVEGTPVGCISAVSYQGHFGFIGLYIVVPAWRGKGVGMQLWNAGMKRLDHHLVGLDGVPAQQENNRKSGFSLAWRNVRYAGTMRSAKPSPSVRQLKEIDFEQLERDDRTVFPEKRARFLKAWIRLEDAVGLALVEDDELRGWGVIRRCREGHKIGALNADTPGQAEALFNALQCSVPDGDAVFLDVPVPNAHALALAQVHDMRPVFETARMYTGPAPEIAMHRVYGVTTFELG